MVRFAIVEWLYTKRTSRQETHLFLFIPNRECKHSFELAHTIRPVAFVHLQSYFRIGVRQKCFAFRREFGA